MRGFEDGLNGYWNTIFGIILLKNGFRFQEYVKIPLKLHARVVIGFTGMWSRAEQAAEKGRMHREK